MKECENGSHRFSIRWTWTLQWQPLNEPKNTRKSNCIVTSHTINSHFIYVYRYIYIMCMYNESKRIFTLKMASSVWKGFFFVPFRSHSNLSNAHLTVCYIVHKIMMRTNVFVWTVLFFHSYWVGWLCVRVYTFSISVLFTLCVHHIHRLIFQAFRNFAEMTNTIMGIDHFISHSIFALYYGLVYLVMLCHDGTYHLLNSARFFFVTNKFPSIHRAKLKMANFGAGCQFFCAFNFNLCSMDFAVLFHSKQPSHTLIRCVLTGFIDSLTGSTRKLSFIRRQMGRFGKHFAVNAYFNHTVSVISFCWWCCH